MILRIPEDLSTWLVSWRLVSNMGNTTPPRDPNDENDEDDEDDEDDKDHKDDDEDDDEDDENDDDERQDEPAVVREPDEPRQR